MLKNEIVFLLVCAWIVLLLVLIPGLVRLSGLPGDLINPLMYLGGVLTLVMLYSLHSYIPILRFFMDDQFDKKVNGYIRWLLEKQSNRIMPRVSPPGRDSDPNFAEVFCDISSYSINGQRMSLSHWVSFTNIGNKRYGAILLGKPGSGKSVTLQALLLAFTNSFFCWSALPKFIFKKNAVKRIISIHQSRLLKFLFDKTWLFPAPPYLPFLLKLQNIEDILKKYNEQKVKGEVTDVEGNLLKPILERLNFEDYSQFRKQLADGRVALLCDGLDELKNEEFQITVFELVKYLWSQTTDEIQNLFLISCRSGSYSDKLRNFSLPGFHEVRLEKLSPNDQKELISRLLRFDYKWVNSKKERKSDLLWNLKKRNNVEIKKNVRPLMGDIFNDITTDIISNIPKIFKQWNPTDFPLSLRRMTSVFLTKPPDILQPQKEVDSELKRVKWTLQIGSLLDYTELIKEDLEEFFKRRNFFAEENGYTISDMMSFYGELAFKYEEINYDIVKNFVFSNLKIKISEEENKGKIDEMINNFLLPGILTSTETHGNQQYYEFRDLESANFLKAFYMYNSPDVAKKIDQFIETHNFSDETLALSMTFSRLKHEALSNFVQNTTHFSNPQMLYALISGVIGSQSFSSNEAEIILFRSIMELDKNIEDAESLRLWQLIRYICFSENYSISTVNAQLLLEMLKKTEILPLNRAQALLVLSELYFFKRIKLNCAWLEGTIKNELDNENVLLSSCSMLSMALLFPEKIKDDDWRRALTVSVPSGVYKLGNDNVEGNPIQNIKVSTFKIARFPVLWFEFVEGKNDRSHMLKPGSAFKPVTRVSFADAEEYAASKSAEIPSAFEFEVVTSYHGGDGKYREYPWGNSFTTDRMKIAFEQEGNLSSILYEDDKVMPVGLKPTLATPAGIFDLVGNIYQFTKTNTVGLLIGDDEEFSEKLNDHLAYGAILDIKSPEFWKNYYFTPVPPQNKYNKYLGFRLLWRWKTSKEK